MVLLSNVPGADYMFGRDAELVSDEQAADPVLVRYYRRDQLLLWALAIGLPFLITGTFMLLALLFS